MITVNVLNDFSEYPGPRYCKQGKDSGELFYHRILNEKFNEAYIKNERLELNLDGTAGYMSSFLDEAIGNLVYDFSEEVVCNQLIIISREEPSWIKLIKDKVIPEWGIRKKSEKAPLKTDKRDHSEWYRLVNSEIMKKVWIPCARQ